MLAQHCVLQKILLSLRKKTAFYRYCFYPEHSMMQKIFHKMTYKLHKCLTIKIT